MCIKLEHKDIKNKLDNQTLFQYIYQYGKRRNTKGYNPHQKKGD
jgi:hypothetical protein